MQWCRVRFRQEFVSSGQIVVLPHFVHLLNWIPSWFAITAAGSNSFLAETSMIDNKSLSGGCSCSYCVVLCIPPPPTHTHTGSMFDIEPHFSSVPWMCLHVRHFRNIWRQREFFSVTQQGFYKLPWMFPSNTLIDLINQRGKVQLSGSCAIGNSKIRENTYFKIFF